MSKNKIKLIVAGLLIALVIVLSLAQIFFKVWRKTDEVNFSQDIFEPEASLNESYKPVEIQTNTDSKFLASENNTKYLSFDNEGSLKLLDQKGKSIDTIEEGDVVDAAFTSDDQVYYQVHGDNYGIYNYAPSNDSKNKATKQKLVNTTDPDFFNNIVYLGNNKYFFIQPKTGKYGYVNALTGKSEILGQQAIVIETANDIDKALFTRPEVSPGGKYLLLIKKAAIYRDTGEPNKYTLQVFPVGEKSFKKPLIQVELGFQSNVNNYKYNWSKDGQFLSIGNDGLVFDLKTKNVLYRGSQFELTQIAFSPSSKMIAICTGDLAGGKCDLKTITNGKLQAAKVDLSNYLPENISELDWVNNNMLVFTVGKSIYSFDISKLKVEKLLPDRADYKIISTNNSTGEITVKKDSSIIELKLKS